MRLLITRSDLTRTGLKRVRENPKGRTVIRRLGRAACPRSSVALPTLALFKLTLDRVFIRAQVLIAGDETLRWSGGKPPFRTCELAGLELSFFGSLGFDTVCEAAVLIRTLRVDQ